MNFGIMEDINAHTECNGLSTASAVLNCLHPAIEGDLDYIYRNYVSNPLYPGIYWQDQGVNTVAYFGACGNFQYNNVAVLNCGTSPE
jgi:hypothetical protein